MVTVFGNVCSVVTVTIRIQLHIAWRKRALAGGGKTLKCSEKQCQPSPERRNLETEPTNVILNQS